ncbi:hypothetical protein FS842_009708 [Serendipita sp. 407]|nr:hypothetical protein FS842_009708 [Serendipita sp. 407]
MATIAPQLRSLQDVFISFVVDSSTPAWEEVHEKYTSKMVSVLGHVLNSKPRLSFILYSSASSHTPPIIIDQYFSSRNDYEVASRAIAGPLTAPIARPLPGGGSASLEALVRAIEHFDLLASLEPSSSQSHKHIFWVAASPPDESSKPFHNNNDVFDEYGWKECENWLRDKAIALNLILTRLPGDPQYLSLFKALNPEAVAPIPPSGSLRVYLSKALSSLTQPPARTQPGQVAPSGPNPTPAYNSPASISVNTTAGASSPITGRKRKPDEETQPSPRKNKFPPNMTSHLHEPTAIKVEDSDEQGSSENKPLGYMDSTLHGVQPDTTMNQPSTSQVSGSLQGINSLQNDRSWQFHLTQALQKSPEDQVKLIMKLRAMYTHADAEIKKAALEGKQTDPLVSKRDRIRQFLEILGRAHRERQNQSQGINTALSAPGQNAASGIGSMSSLITNETKPTSLSDVTGHKAPLPNTGVTTTVSSGLLGTANPEQSQPPQNQPGPQVPVTTIPTGPPKVWAGHLSITNNGKSMLDLFVSLTLAKGNAASAQAPRFWPQSLLIRPFRQGVVPQQLVLWLASNQPDGVYTVNAASLGDWPSTAQAQANEAVMTQMKLRFIQAQNNIANARWVLMGTPGLSTGGSNTILVFHMPASRPTGEAPTQLVLARFVNAPNLATLPGVAAGGVQKPQEPSSTNFNPSTMAKNTIQTNSGAHVPNNAQNNAYSGLNAGMPTVATQLPNASNLVNSGPSTATPGISGNQYIAGALARLGPKGQEFLRLVGGAENPNLVNLVKNNPELTAQLRALYQGQNRANNAAGANAAGKGPLSVSATGGRVPGVGGPLGNISGATLLDRLDSTSLAQSNQLGGNPGAFNSLYGSQTGRPLQSQQQSQQQLLTALSAQNSSLGGTQTATQNTNLNNHGSLFNQLGGLSSNPMAMTMNNNNNNTNLASGITGTNNPPFNGSMHGMNIPGLMGGMGRGSNPMNTGIGGAGTATGPSREILAQAKLLAERQGIGIQEALLQIVRNFNPGGWNTSGRGGGA